MPETRICKNCKKDFHISDENLKFYEKVSPVFEGKKYIIPSPTFCPDCRQQRRWAFRNQQKLYKRACDFSGEKMISLYSPDKPFKVYKEDIWWSDKWDPMQYGKDFDFTRPFFEQFAQLLLAVPRRGMHQDGTNENSQYTTFGFSNNNCYYTFASFRSENLYYGTLCSSLRDSCDCFICFSSELLYECTDCKNCYDCNFCDNCENCTNGTLLDDCRDCSNCIACKNLRKKQYHIYNKPVSKGEFLNFRANLKENFANEKAEFDKWKLRLPFISTHMINSENCSGDYIENCRNCHLCFDVFQGAQDCEYCNWSREAHDIMDCCMAGGSELLYEVTATAFAHSCAFMNFCRNSNDIYYCDCISSCSFCFGCTGLNHKQYCIFNKQYTRGEYEKLVPKIIKHMKQTGEWGEFFPISISPFAYNETVAQEYFPLKKEEASEKGYKWLRPAGRMRHVGASFA